jgi:hypothetical protein
VHDRVKQVFKLGAFYNVARAQFEFPRMIDVGMFKLGRGYQHAAIVG